MTMVEGADPRVESVLPLVFGLLAAQRRLRRKPLGMPLTDLEVLWALRDGPMDQVHIARVLGLDKSTVNRVVQRLREQGRTANAPRGLVLTNDGQRELVRGQVKTLAAISAVVGRPLTEPELRAVALLSAWLNV